MGFREIVEAIGKGGGGNHGWPAGASERYKRLAAYERLLNGTIYDHIQYPFDIEKGSAGRYIPVRERRPSIKYGLAKIVVDQHASLTFGEAHFPHVRCYPGDDREQSAAQRKTEAACAALIKGANLSAVMQSALVRGSVGSAALVAKIRGDGTPHVDVVSGKNARPRLNIDNPFKLDGLERMWDIDGESLSDFGYEIKKEDYAKTFWLRVSIDKSDWTWYKPLSDEDYRDLGQDKNGQKIRWVEDKERSGAHGFGVVPAVWLRNLMAGDDSIDGPCTFAEIVDICVALDYELSQTDRGLRYSMDPLLVIKMGEMGQAALDLARKQSGTGDLTHSPADALPLMGEDSDAKLLEITGNGFAAARDFIKQIRDYGLEVAGGLKADQENSTGRESSKALELWYQPVVWFIERLRASYGDNGLIPLLRIMLPALASGDIDLRDGNDWSGVDLDSPLSLVWPKWWLPRGADLLAEMQAIQTAVGGSLKDPKLLVPVDVGSRLAAQTVDLDDPNATAIAANKDRTKLEAQQQAQAELEAQNGASQSGGTPGGNN